MSSGRLRFDGRVAVVSGAAGGMGRQHAQLLSERGAAIVLVDLVDPSGVVAGVRAAGGSAVGIIADVADPATGETVIETAVRSFGQVDIVVNNAGILRSDDVVDTTDEVWEEVLGVNLRGGFALTRAAWPVMARNGYGRVVFTSSNSGLLGIPGSSAYAASKAALWGLVRVLALEGADAGIRVNAVAPLAFTAMSSRSRAAPESWRSGKGDAWAARLSPDLVSPVVAWLAHEACGLTGEVLSTGGGRVARFFLGLTQGFVDDALTVESVHDHLAEILAEDIYDVHRSAAEENRALYRRVNRR